MFWRERNARPGVTPIGLIVGRVIGLVLVLCLAVGTYWFAMPAFRELAVRGYGASSARVVIPEVTPFATALVLGTTTGGPPPGMARVEFNVVLRQSTLLWGLIYVLCVAGLAAAGVASEKVRDTWSGLIATPLTGREILRAKMLGVVWKARGWVAVMVGLWTVGLLAGAIHPLGFFATLVSLGVSTWFIVALGTYHSLWSRDTSQATNRTILPLTLLLLSPIVLLVGARRGGLLAIGAGSWPFQAYLSLVTFEEVGVALRAGAFPRLSAMGMASGEGAWSVLATYLIGLIGQAVAALLLTRAAFRGFDAAVGRPVRLDEAHPAARVASPGVLAPAYPAPVTAR